MSDLDEIIDIQIAVSDAVPGASSGGGGGGGGPTLNAPVLSVQSTAVTGASVVASITTSDSDGATTTGVQVLDNGVLLGSATGGAGSWSYTITNITTGTHSLVPRRQTAQGNVDGTSHDVIASVGNQPGSAQVDLSTGKVQVDLTTGKVEVGL